MSTISFLGLDSLSFNRCEVNPRTRICGTFASVRMTIDSKSSERTKIEEISMQIPSTPLPVPGRESLFTAPQFDRLQQSDDGLSKERKHEFGSFVARDAMLNEEYWAAAWIRAESHWENRVKDRYADNHKRQFAEQEFNELKKRSIWQQRQKGTCIVAVRKAVPNVQRTVLKSIVGTLDLSIRYLLPGETYPGERVHAPPFCRTKRTPENRYCYIANVCVVISVRRQGIASNMLHFAVESAISDGIGLIYMHVHKFNEGALELYRKAGFEIVEQASSHLLEEKMFLLRFKM